MEHRVPVLYRGGRSSASLSTRCLQPLRLRRRRTPPGRAMPRAMPKRPRAQGGKSFVCAHRETEHGAPRGWRDKVGLTFRPGRSQYSCWSATQRRGAAFVLPARHRPGCIAASKRNQRVLFCRALFLSRAKRRPCRVRVRRAFAMRAREEGYQHDRNT